MNIKADHDGATCWRLLSAHFAHVARGKPVEIWSSSVVSRFAPPIKGGARGYDAAKKITGRKRHILTDTDGRLLAVRVHAADVQDRDGAKLALKASRASFPFVQTVFADGGYAGRLEAWARAKANLALSIVRRPRTLPGFEPLPRRWVIERSFAWLIKNWRLVRDFEQHPETPSPPLQPSSGDCAEPSQTRSHPCGTDALFLAGVLGLPMYARHKLRRQRHLTNDSH